MNDEHGTDPQSPGSDREPSPVEDARIRALLAELGSGPDGEPMPRDVADRLDDTLARLVAERDQADAGTPGTEDRTVVPLRRRWLPRASAAAAAVIILGGGGVAAANLGIFGGSGSDMTAGGSADSTAAESAPDSASTTPAPSAGSLEGREAGGGAAAPPELRAASFAADVAALLDRRTALVTPDGEPDGKPDAGASEGSPSEDRDAAKLGPTQTRRLQACPGPQVTDGAVANPIRYDGAPAVLLVHPEQDGRRLVEAWDCAGDRRLAATTLTP